MSQSQGIFIGQIFSQAWEVFKKRWGAIYLVSAAPMIIGAIYNVVVGSNIDPFAMVLVFFAYMIAQIVVSMGVIKGLLTIVKGESLSWSIFSFEPKSVINFLIGNILVFFIVMGGFILFIIPGIIWSIKYQFVPYLIVDKKMSAMDAIKKSGELTNGIKWDLFAYGVAAGVLAISGILALFFGLLVTIPVASIAYPILYRQVLNRK